MCCAGFKLLGCLNVPNLSMFELQAIAGPAYSDPWQQSWAQRYTQLCQQPTRIAYYYECANNSTFRYRAYNMVQVLNETPGSDISASYFFESDQDHFSDIVAQADLLVICRTHYSPILQRLALLFKARGKPVLFDVDDLVFDTRYTHLLINSLNLDADNISVMMEWFSGNARMGEALRLCEGAITTNDFLAQKIKAFHDVPVAVVPNFINKEQMTVSDVLYAQKQANGFRRSGDIHIGYFSGSPSHALDLAVMEEGLCEILANRPDVKLVMVGYIEPSEALRLFKRQIIYHGFQNFMALQQLIASVDINLMPLQVNSFTNCKSELKYFEAAIVGTLSLASPSHTYQRAIQHGHNGFIAQGHEWGAQLAKMIEALPSSQEMMIVAHDHAESQYAWTQQYDVLRRSMARWLPCLRA
jgi:glycosyltransferase involved in cell wall biosynthesis